MKYYSPGRIRFYRYQVLPVASGILRTDRSCQTMAFLRGRRSAMASERRMGAVIGILDIHMEDPGQRKHWVRRHENKAVAAVTCCDSLSSEAVVRGIPMAGRTDWAAGYHYSLGSILLGMPKDLVGFENHGCGLSGRCQNSHLEHSTQLGVNGFVARC